MIGRLRGKVVAEDPGGTVVVDVAGVGYELFMPLGTVGRARSEPSGEAVFHVHTHVREEALDLFGFASDAERRVFRVLLSVPSVGPKTALAVMSALPLPELARAVHHGDVARLMRVPGIGKKSAERFVLELKDKLGHLDPGNPADPGDRVPAASPPKSEDAKKLSFALTNMGYKAAEAERAVRSLGPHFGKEPMTDLLRRALALLTP
jgi:Holliday junction DNA helicase RuvA